MVSDLSAKLFGYGFEKFFSDVFEVADFAIVLVTFVTSIVLLATASTSGKEDGPAQTQITDLGHGLSFIEPGHFFFCVNLTNHLLTS